jgi:hypothetical protein
MDVVVRAWRIVKHIGTRDGMCSGRINVRKGGA